MSPKSGSTDHVVDLAPLGIGQDLIGLVDLLEPLDRLGFGVDVRVPLLSELAEGALDLGVVGVALDAQDSRSSSVPWPSEKDTRRSPRAGSAPAGAPLAVLRPQQLAQSTRSDDQTDRAHDQEVGHVEQKRGVGVPGRQGPDQMNAAVERRALDEDLPAPAGRRRSGRTCRRRGTSA
jgi:hypothetical protein